MRIAIVTPLFPPDIGAPAPYVKTLAERLTEHTVIVAGFGRYPEQVEGVTFHLVDKQVSAVLRVIRLCMLVWKLRHSVDVFYVQNGISVELPMLVLSFISRVPIVYVWSDALAVSHAEQSLLRRFVAQALTRRVARHMSILDTIDTLTKPEILPLKDRPDAALAEYETAWQQHVSRLNETFTYVCR